MTAIETINDRLVGIAGTGHIVIARPPLMPMGTDEALRMAAWIVALVGDDVRFAEILRAVRST